MILIGLLCNVLLQSEVVEFDFGHKSDEVICERFFRMHKVQSGLGEATTGRMLFRVFCDDRKYSQIARQCEAQFGIRLSHVKPFKDITSESYDFTLAANGLDLDGVLSDFSPDSTVGKALMQLKTNGDITSSDVLLDGSYCLAPWITKRLKYTETAKMKFTLQRKNKKINYVFFYEPD